MPTKFERGLFVIAATITIIAGAKTLLPPNISSWWQGLTPWRVTFWSSICVALAIGGDLYRKWLNHHFETINDRFFHAARSIEARFQAIDERLSKETATPAQFQDMGGAINVAIKEVRALADRVYDLEQHPKPPSVSQT